MENEHSMNAGLASASSSASGAVVDNDQRERALAVTESFIVQAPAGSGKTELLTRRVLTLMTTVDVPEEILAITFTRKAAAEMRHRIHSILRDANDAKVAADAHEARGLELAAEVLKRNNELQWGLLENPQRLSLQTIDSLCASLTRQLPVTSSFGAPLATEEQAQPLYMKAVGDIIQSGLRDNAEHADSTRALLYECDNRVSQLQNMLAALLASRDQWLRHVPLGAGIVIDREQLQHSLDVVVEQRLQGLADSWPAVLDDEFFSILGQADETHYSLRAASGEDLSALQQPVPMSRPQAVAHDGPVWTKLALALLTAAGTVRKTVNKNNGFPVAAADAKLIGIEKSVLDARKKRFVEILKELTEHAEFCEQLTSVAALPFDGFSDKQFEVLEHVCVLLQHSVAELMWVFGQTGKCDFSEISQRAQRALGTAEEPTDLALAMDYRIRHILVDEFQDTSLSQFQLFEKLVAGWEAGDGRTFFAVGDPMQSIYRFRDAEVSLFSQARDFGVADISLESLQLVVNFRSDPVLVEWCNSSFSEVFPQEFKRIAGAVPFSPSTAFKSTDPESCFELIPFAAGSDVLQANTIAERVREAFAVDADQTIAILVRSKSHLVEIFSALRDAGIACQALEMESLANRPVVRDIKALVFALMHMSDRISWLSLLRGPWCGLSLHELNAVVEISRYKPIWNIINEHLPELELSPESGKRLQSFIDVMTPAVIRANREELVAWVESSWLQLGGPAVCSAVNGVDAAADAVSGADLVAADTAFRVLSQLEADALIVDRKVVESRLAALFAPPADVAEPFVQMMTVHKSKGLEFDTVILPNLGRRAGADRSKLLNWFELNEESGNTELLLAPLNTAVDPAETDKINKLIASYHNEREKNERVRLMYVAATRAKKRLYCLGHTKIKTDNTVAEPDSGSMLRVLWPVVSEQFEVLTEEDAALAIETNVATVQAPGLLRLQGDWQVPDVPAPVKWQETGESEEPEAEFEVPEFLWASMQASAIGVVVHRQLQRICEEGAVSWSATKIEASAADYRRQLLANGIGENEANSCVARVVKALTQSITDQRGLWVLDGSHSESQSELALSSVYNGVVENIIIDRTFVDDKGVCWIIDYKTGDHRGGSVDKFLDQEQERYRPQLEKYARILRHSTDRKIVLGLYFPLLQGWREWQSPA